MGVKLSAALGGSVELVPTNTASNYTATMPAKTGTVGMDGPAFSAYMTNSSAAQSISGSTWTKVKLDTEEFDTNSNFDTATYRFTPTVAGYYQVNASALISYTSSAPSIIQAAIYKNGTSYKAGYLGIVNPGPYGNVAVSALIYFNGSTDYIELYAWSNSASATVEYSSGRAFMNGCLVRGA